MEKPKITAKHWKSASKFPIRNHRPSSAPQIRKQRTVDTIHSPDEPPDPTEGMQISVSKLPPIPRKTSLSTPHLGRIETSTRTWKNSPIPENCKRESISDLKKDSNIIPADTNSIPIKKTLKKYNQRLDRENTMPMRAPWGSHQGVQLQMKIIEPTLAPENPVAKMDPPEKENANKEKEKMNPVLARLISKMSFGKSKEKMETEKDIYISQEILFIESTAEDSQVEDFSPPQEAKDLEFVLSVEPGTNEVKSHIENTNEILLPEKAKLSVLSTKIPPSRMLSLSPNQMKRGSFRLGMMDSTSDLVESHIASNEDKKLKKTSKYNTKALREFVATATIQGVKTPIDTIHTVDDDVQSSVASSDDTASVNSEELENQIIQEQQALTSYDPKDEILASSDDSRKLNTRTAERVEKRKQDREAAMKNNPLIKLNLSQYNLFSTTAGAFRGPGDIYYKFILGGKSVRPGAKKLKTAKVAEVDLGKLDEILVYQAKTHTTLWNHKSVSKLREKHKEFLQTSINQKVINLEQIRAYIVTTIYGINSQKSLLTQLMQHNEILSVEYQKVKKESNEKVSNTLAKNEESVENILKLEKERVQERKRVVKEFAMSLRVCKEERQGLLCLSYHLALERKVQSKQMAYEAKIHDMQDLKEFEKAAFEDPANTEKKVAKEMAIKNQHMKELDMHIAGMQNRFLLLEGEFDQKVFLLLILG
jgi:hypothetical protein